MSAAIVTGIVTLRDRLRAVRAAGRTVGLVPTMGALHAGHGALIECARRETDCVVVSIFVNPIQFDRRDDFEAYTIDLAADAAFCGQLGADFVFAPTPAEMYPVPNAAFVDVLGVSEHLCGAARPGHFRGVATVVTKLFLIAAPDRAYFGEKDAQQLAIIERMVADLNFPITVVPVPIVREPDGLALSSRNRRLTAEEREVAPVVYQALERVRDRIRNGCHSAADAKRAGLQLLERYPQFRIDYLEVVGAATMVPVERVEGPVRIAAAVWLGSTRLIDNVAG